MTQFNVTGVTPLVGWQNFYVIVGSSADALIGLQFVVKALVADLHNVNYQECSADSQYLSWDNFGTTHPTCRRIKVGEHQAEDLFPIEDLRRYLGIFGSWSGEAPEGSRIFTRDLSTQDVYALPVDLP